MCRLGFYVGEQADITRQIILSTAKWGNTNSHGTGIAWREGEETKLMKEPIEATHFWDKTETKVNTNAGIFHVRYATGSTHDTRNTHPFVDKITGIAIAHNGILSNYDGAKKEIESKGFTFCGECDSEVVLWAYIYKGVDFVDWLNEKEVGGSATFIILDKNEVFFYTNNKNIEVFKTPTGIFAFSDDVLGYHEKYTHYEIEAEKIYKATKDTLFMLKETKGLAKYKYTAYDEKETVQTKLVKSKKGNKKFKVSKNELEEIREYCKSVWKKEWKVHFQEEIKEWVKAKREADQTESSIQETIDKSIREDEEKIYNYGNGLYD